MYRRQVLATGALTLALPLTGCLEGGDDEFDTEGDDDDPIDNDPESLLLTADQVETVMDEQGVGEEWNAYAYLEEGGTMYRDATVGQTLMPFDGEDIEFDGGRVVNGVWYHDKVDEAREAYETHPLYWEFFEEEDAGITDVSIAVDSIARLTEGWVFVLFRDANAVGAVSYRNPERGDEETGDVAAAMAAEMHKGWRE